MASVEFNGVTEQRKAAYKRLRDALCLLGGADSVDWFRKKGAHARGAMYLAGYAIECKAKAIAMEALKCRTLAQLASKLRIDERDVYVHGLEVLLQRSRQRTKLKNSPVWRDFAGVVNRWRPAWRYDPQDALNSEAKAFLDAVRRVYDWMDSNRF